MKDLKLKELLQKLLPLMGFFKKYIVLIFILGLVGIYGFLVFRINTLNNVEPSEDAVSDQLQTVTRPKIDKASVDKIQQLQGQNVEVKTLFDQARNNPFSE
jgi:hypothetical protein